MKKLILCILLCSCASVTKEDRAIMYASFAKDHKFKCSAYQFDLSAGLVDDVPTMTEVCK